MLPHTFLHLPGVGQVTEQELWLQGITTWREFMEAPRLPWRLEGRRWALASILQECMDRLERGDARFFKACLPSRERWRMYGDFRPRTAYLDIETTGLSPYFSTITLIGLLDQRGYRAFVLGENLEEFPEAAAEYDMVVTFNGVRFDVPFIERRFGPVLDHAAHLDLLYPLRRLGIRGGLKRIEVSLGLERASALEGLSGYHAVVLWRLWDRHGIRSARDTLVRYNAEDVATLPLLAEYAYNALLAGLPVPRPPLAPSPRPQVDLPFDPDLVRYLVTRGEEWV